PAGRNFPTPTPPPLRCATGRIRMGPRLMGVRAPTILRAVNSTARPEGHGGESPRPGPRRPGEFHIPSLDGIRAISFLVVFVAHAGYGHVIPGGFGVTVFFFL